MNKITKEYREAQLNKVATEYVDFPTKIKIIKPDGETNWLNITEKELLAIKAVLLLS